MTKTTSNKFDRTFRIEKFDQSARNEHLKSKSSFRALGTKI